MHLTKTKIIIFMVVFNCYLFFSLFFGENTILNFFAYKAECEKLNQQNQDLIKQRYQLGKISSILSSKNKNADTEDILDEFLRTTTQSSLPEEKIVFI